MTTVFYMWSQYREDLIAKHNFYVKEGKARLTDQFSEDALGKAADEFSEAWLKRMEKHFDPDRDDPAAYLEQVNDEEIGFYLSLDELGNSVRLTLISGMFHLWERSLKEWLTSRDGIRYWHVGDALPKAIWKSNFNQVFEIFECAGLFQNDSSIKDDLDTCRMVVNTYKHGAGPSLDELKLKRPELFDQYGLRSRAQYTDYIDHSDLYVKTAQIDEFSEAIVSFWRELPEYITEAELQTVPKWFQDAYERDCRGANNANLRKDRLP